MSDATPDVSGSEAAAEEEPTECEDASGPDDEARGGASVVQTALGALRAMIEPSSDEPTDEE